MNRWQVLATDSANTRWFVMFAPRALKVAEIVWVERIDSPMHALECIAAGLNKQRGDRQPLRCWSFGEQRATGWPILHNGHEMGEISWTFPPPTPPEVWQAHILAGLNHVDERRGIYPPAPAAPRHLKAVS